MAKTLCLCNFSDQAFWQLTPPMIQTISAALPGDVSLQVAEDKKSLLSAVKTADYIFGLPFSANLVRGNKNLKWVHFWSAQVPESWSRLQQRGVMVTDSRGLNADSVVQHGCYLIYRALRGEPLQNHLSRWSPESFAIAQNPAELTLGILGFGEIGARLATAMSPLFGQTQVLTRSPRDDQSDCRFYTVEQRQEFLSSSDYLVMALPLNKATRSFFDADFYQQLKAGVTLINLARGELLDESELLAHLGNDRRSRYLTDVVAPEPYPDDGPLLNHPQVFITPHVGGRQAGIWDKLIERTLALMAEHMKE